MKDRHGNTVGLGDVVRVVEICPEFLDVLPEDELVHIEKMLNQEYPIDDFPEQHKASVSISWEIEPGLTGHSGLYMLSHEFELVRKAETAVGSKTGSGLSFRHDLNPMANLGVPIEV
jgi:hypothetical protein